jgi:NAD(P)-dependent dehydrogenase (short-subunit alcohol dehydrogenase family)
MHEVDRIGGAQMPASSPTSSQSGAIDSAGASGPLLLNSFGTGISAAVIGATGGIGEAFADLLSECPSVENIIHLSRNRALASDRTAPWLPIDLEDERSIAHAASSIEREFGSLDLVIVASGILYDGDRLQPEKSWRTIESDAMERSYRINAIGPALVAKHFLPLLTAERKSVFAALSARVGSIEDNQLGGWHAYRASKAALNMILKTLSIEIARRNPSAICVGLHPGTVDTRLSEPFQRGVPEGKLFSPKTSARCLLNVLDSLSPEQSGQVFAWDGRRIPG